MVLVSLEDWQLYLLVIFFSLFSFIIGYIFTHYLEKRI